MRPPEEGLDRIVLLLRPDADPIAGWIQIDGDARQPFTGWMEFMSLLQRPKSALRTRVSENRARAKSRNDREENFGPGNVPCADG